MAPRPEKAAAIPTKKLPAMILPLGQGWLCDQVATLLMNCSARSIKATRICNLFQAHEVTIQGGVGDPEIAFGL